MRCYFFLLNFLLTVAAGASELTLTERVEVIERRPHLYDTVALLFPLEQAIDVTSFSADSLATLLQQSPSVMLNGQGGLFQTINIRGFSRWRVQTRIEGIPIHTDRRAGTAMEFLPPNLVTQAQVLTGAASTQLGSGALGGGIDVRLLDPQHTHLQLSYGQQQDYRDMLVAGLNESHQLSWLLNHRHANNSRDSRGNLILDGFEQHSLALRKRNDNGLIREGLVFFSTANNVEKASADDPLLRYTYYPLNQHWLGKLDFDWLNASWYVHDAKTQTLVDRPNLRLNALQNDALNTGFQLNDTIAIAHWQLHWRTGVDARLGVRVAETQFTPDSSMVFAQMNLDADQWESFVSSEVSRQFGQQQVVAGTRLSNMRQYNRLTQQSLADNNASGYLGYHISLHPHWQLSTYLSSAYRVPSLTERFFTGTTPRGRDEGNSELATEQATSVDVRMQYQTSAIEWGVGIFQQALHNYIERIPITSELRRYQNIDDATIQGLNYSGEYRFEALDQQWRWHLGGQWLTGERREGQAIADIPPGQHRLSLSALGAAGQGFIALTHRQRSRQEAPDEQPLASVTYVDAGYQYELNAEFRLSVNLTNITNRHYLVSRDVLAPFARGRDIHISVQFMPLGS